MSRGPMNEFENDVLKMPIYRTYLKRIPFAMKYHKVDLFYRLLSSDIFFHFGVRDKTNLNSELRKILIKKIKYVLMFNVHNIILTKRIIIFFFNYLYIPLF